MNYKSNEVNLLRRTKGFHVYRAAKNRARIIAREPGAQPKSRHVRWRTWLQMEKVSDSEFDGTCVMDLGIGVFLKPST